MATHPKVLGLTLDSKLTYSTHIYNISVPTTPACTWWNRPEEDPSSGKMESTHPSRTSVKYDQVFFGVESIMRVNAASLDIRDATTSTPGTLNDLTTDLIMANNNNISVQAHTPLQMIKALPATGWDKQKETLMAPYKAVMKPALEYVSSIWSPLASSTSINKLQAMLNVH